MTAKERRSFKQLLEGKTIAELDVMRNAYYNSNPRSTYAIKMDDLEKAKIIDNFLKNKAK